MSTKIYDAFRAPSRRVNEAVLLLRSPLQDAAMRELRNMIHLLPVDTRKTRSEYVEEAIKKCVEALGDSHRGDFDLQCWVTVWMHGRYAYIKPGAQFRMPNFRVPRWLRSWEYWNNSDPPEGVSDEEWEQRGKEWDEVIACPRLHHTVVDVSDLYARIDLEIAFRKWEQSQ